MHAARPLSALVLFAGCLGAASCVTDNPAAYEGILGPTRAEASASGGTAGSDTGGTGALPTGGSSGAAGTTGGDGGMSEGGQGATGASGGSSGSGTGKNPPPHPDFSPPCYFAPTLAGEEILKGTPCTPDDIKLCYRSCGPNQTGWKSETCTAGVYAEGDCRFPDDQDYSCYRVPELPEMPDTVACKVTAPPAATDPCEAPSCTACNFDGFYADTAGDAKEGYCICRDADEMGVRRWTCASTTAWPCPISRGCF